nr:MAG TPA: hypothetical protein [Caudoviricetes sp.]
MERVEKKLIFTNFLYVLFLPLIYFSFLHT